MWGVGGQRGEPGEGASGGGGRGVGREGAGNESMMQFSGAWVAKCITTSTITVDGRHQQRPLVNEFLTSLELDVVLPSSTSGDASQDQLKPR